MQNDQGEYVDMYIPRKCSSTNRVIHAKDRASVQLTFAKLNERGIITTETKAVVLCGQVRLMGESDGCVNGLAKEAGFLPAELF